MSEVLLSIISVTRNPAPAMLDTISGINRFVSDEVEYVLVDGNSEEKIRNQMQALLHQNSKFLSEPDQGIYDAMNKAWELASGKYLLFLNEGDELLHLPLEILRTSTSDVLLGSVFLDDDARFQGRNSVLLFFRNLWPHQGTFYRREIAYRYNTTFRIFADFDLNQRLIRQKARIRHLAFSHPIARHLSGGISGQQSGLAEFYSIIRTNFGVISVALAFFWFKLEGLNRRVSQALWASN
jgi:glycosyltransferase involved in cell wall biosynthesis